MSFPQNPDKLESTKSENDYMDTKIGQFNKDTSVATIYVGNLSYELTEVEIKDMFEAYGFVSYVKLIKDQESHSSTGIAFVQMAHRNHARAAIKDLDGSSIDGRKLKVRVAKETNKDRPVIKVAKIRRKPYKAYVSKADRTAAAASTPAISE